MRMSKLCLAAALLALSAGHFTMPAEACKSRPHPASLCAVVPASGNMLDAPGGRVAYAASGKVQVGGYSKDGLWAHIEVPCMGFVGWIARQDLTCEAASASADGVAKLP